MVCHHITQSSGSSTQSPNSGQVPDFGRKKFAIEGERKPSALIGVGFLQRNAGDAHRAQTRARQQRPR